MTPQTLDPVKTRLDGGIFRITLCRPPLNVLNREALDALAAALSDAEGDDRAKVVLLSGEGRGFCAGVDVADHMEDQVRGMIVAFHRVVDGFLRCRHPVVTAVHGPAFGGGMELVLASDMALLHEDARLGQPEIGLGVFPPGATALLPQLVGRQRAADLVLTGRTLSAPEAHDVGLAVSVLADDAYEEGVEKYVKELASHSGPVLRLTKRALRAGREGSVSAALLEGHRIYLEELMQLADPHEGLAAFMEKREPVWRDA